MLKRPRRSRLDRVEAFVAQHRPGLTISLSIVGVVVVALATHVVEQILGSTDKSWVPLLLFGLFAIIGGILLYLRERIAHHRGTLFYLRLLHPWMRDLHDIALEARLRGQAEDKVIARWIAPTQHPVVDDVSTAVAGIVAEAERCLNDDTSETGTHVVPNMVWSAALAVGFDLPQLIRDGVELIELLPEARGNRPIGDVERRRRRPVGSVDWMPATPVDEPDHRHDRPRVIWLPCVPAGHLVRSVALMIELTCEGRGTPVERNVDVFARLGAYQHAHAEASIMERLVASPAPSRSAKRRVLIDEPTRPVEVDFDVHRARQRAMLDHVEKWTRTATPRDGAGIPLLRPDDFREELLVLHPHTAAVTCWRAIRQALHRYPDADVLLGMRVPKTVALAVGSMLAIRGQDRGNPGCREFWPEGQTSCWQASCLRPWDRIVPLSLDESTYTYRIARVHTFQPSATALAQKL